MYTEVKTFVNFVCRYMFGRVPRRATGILAAELGNCLVAQFSSSWDVKNPRNGEMERMIFIKCGADGSSKCFESCAGESGLRVDEVLENMPAQLRILANPGLLFYRATESGVDVPMWKGDVKPDSHYQPIPEHIVRTASRKADSCSNLGGAGKPVLLTKKFPIDDLGKTGIFAAELGNCLVAQFSSSWDIKNPRNGEMKRMMFIKFRTKGSSKCFESCAAESGLRVDEVLVNMQAQLRIFANPRLLYYRATENGGGVPIWKGDVNT
ncbi:hypothetical protein B9Z55_002408 [Caenorhabditis nigoni]|uniref:Anti-proliferative protein domain-containing protein n=1 Tax=Caenorhabditis nigoni TaxID=1611254 RepID=A0A2G5VKD1_9PELO|nr:hypothetical protein B9Z55_002408 [Caenorhabditis nigoni]